MAPTSLCGIYQSWMLLRFLEFNFHRVLKLKSGTSQISVLFCLFFQRAYKMDFTFIYISWL